MRCPMLSPSGEATTTLARPLGLPGDGYPSVALLRSERMVERAEALPSVAISDPARPKSARAAGSTSRAG